MPTLRRCRGCPTLIPSDSYRGRCRQCLAAYGQVRGTPAERGYDAAHQRESRQWKARIAAGERVECWRCGKPITDPSDCDLGHDDDDRSVIRGPEHARGCNRRAAGRAGARARR